MNKYKQMFYKYVTTPIAKFLDYVNVSKSAQIALKRESIARENLHQYLEITSKVLFEQDVAKFDEEQLNPVLLTLLAKKNFHVAVQMFNEKKRNGDFDDLNLMLK